MTADKVLSILLIVTLLLLASLVVQVSAAVKSIDRAAWLSVCVQALSAGVDIDPLPSCDLIRRDDAQR